MTYEYTHTDAPDTSHRLGDLPTDFARLGADGWDLICVVSRPGMSERAHFKRAIAPPVPLTNGALKGATAPKKGAR